MAEPNELVRLGKAMLEIAAAKTIDDCRKITDKAEAARYYAKKIGMSIDTQNDLAEIVIESMARAGEILDDMKKSGERQKSGEYQKSSVMTIAPTLKDMNLTKQQSHVYQKVAAVPASERKRYLMQSREEKKLATATGLFREQKTENEKGGGGKRKKSKAKSFFDPEADCLLVVSELVRKFWVGNANKETRCAFIEGLRSLVGNYEEKI